MLFRIRKCFARVCFHHRCVIFYFEYLSPESELKSIRRDLESKEKRVNDMSIEVSRAHAEASVSKIDKDDISTVLLRKQKEQERLNGNLLPHRNGDLTNCLFF